MPTEQWGTDVPYYVDVYGRKVEYTDPVSGKVLRETVYVKPQPRLERFGEHHRGYRGDELVVEVDYTDDGPRLRRPNPFTRNR